MEGKFGVGDASRALSGIDIVGDIGIIKVPDSLMERRHEMGEMLLERLPSLKAVYRQTTPVNIVERVRGVEWLAGEKRTTTIYVESGCSFKVDISRVYFSPRLSFERRRVAGICRPGETVVNMFAGVGTFSIVMARLAGVKKVYSIDCNPVACELMVENVEMNGMADRVIPLMGDAKDFVRSLRGTAERVLMPLPERAIDYMEHAVKYLSGRGWLHIYLHTKGRRREDAMADAERQTAEGAAAIFNIMEMQSRVVRSIGSRTFQVVVDAYGEVLTGDE
ncbi:MAG TPA: 50S ribosomal protein L11 methyltransferase [Candidatus Methanomethylicus sp.]|nr:50S ribosomal protein L11 methyltransferase [Candidatus Methanomethylicus sp.]HRU81066.1 50S ribosomal protein L11 methyltransferase [Candidatus Methanomethylicus sp.]